jgi:large subunit ribosomal protein L23
MLKVDRIILDTVLTEKATAATSTSNTYTFKVSSCANKVQVAQAVKSVFPKVDVTQVRILNVHPKLKASRVRRGQVSVKGGYKKALVTLKPGQSIDLA